MRASSSLFSVLPSFVLRGGRKGKKNEDAVSFPRRTGSRRPKEDGGILRPFLLCGSQGAIRDEKAGLETVFLDLEGKTRVELLSSSSCSAHSGYHLSIGLASREEDHVAKKAKEEGLEVLSGPRMTGDGYYKVSFLSSEGHPIDASDIPA